MLGALGRTVTLLQLEKAKREYISRGAGDGEWHLPRRWLPETGAQGQGQSVLELRFS